MLCGATKSDVAPQPERRSPRAAAIFFHRRSSFFVVFPRGRGKDISPFVVFAPCARKGEARRSSDSDQRPRPRRWCEPHRRRQPSSSSAFCLLPSCSCSSAGNARRRPTARRRGRQRSGPGAGGRAAAKGRRPGRLLHPVRLLVVLARAGRRTTLPADAAVAWPHRRALVLTIPLVLLMCRARQIGLPGPHGDHHLRRLPRRMRRRLWQLPR
jgi:hypothetical protein